LNEEPKALENVPSELQVIVSKTLCRNLEDRYADVTEFLNDLTDIRENYVLNKNVQPSQKNTRKKAIIISTVAVLILIVAIAGIFIFPTSEPEESIKSLAVLPFSNHKPDANTDYLGLAFAAEIINDMSYLKNITTLPFSSVREISSMEQIEVDVDYILTGNFIKFEDVIKLNVECFEPKTEEIIWQESLNRTFNESHVLLSDVSNKVIERLKIQFSPDEQDHMQIDLPHNQEAYEYYLRSLSYSSPILDDSLAIILLKKSILLDSTFAPAYEELGFRTLRYRQGTTHKASDYQQAEYYFLKALSINKNLIISLNYLAGIYTEIGNYDKAMDLVKKALDINPNYAHTHFQLSYIYRYAGCLEQSKEEAEIALKIDSNNKRFRSIGHTYRYLGEYDRAIGIYNLDEGSAYVFYS